MRILWSHNFSPNNPVSGVFMRSAAEALTRRGVYPELMYLGNLRSPLELAKARDAVRVRAQGFDLVHSQYGSGAALVTSAIRDRPLVVSLRGSDWTPAYSRTVLGRAHATVATRLSRRVLPRFSSVVCVSHRMAAEVQTEFPTLRTLVLPDPVDLELFTPGDRAEARRSLGLDPERRYVLFTSVHRNNPLKRLELAEAAVAVARRKHPDIEFLIASGYAHDSMPTLFRASNVSLCTSVSEGWPNCIKESLACGIGFVSTDVSDLRAIALVDDTCKITEATPEALGMALNDALEEQSGMDKRRHVEAMSMPNFARLLVAEYEQLLSGTWRASG